MFNLPNPLMKASFDKIEDRNVLSVTVHTRIGWIPVMSLAASPLLCNPNQLTVKALVEALPNTCLTLTIAGAAEKEDKPFAMQPAPTSIYWDGEAAYVCPPGMFGNIAATFNDLSKSSMEMHQACLQIELALSSYGFTKVPNYATYGTGWQPNNPAMHPQPMYTSQPQPTQAPVSLYGHMQMPDGAYNAPVRPDQQQQTPLTPTDKE
ncbi:MAG: hypothetical protein [Bacteriophage sp.]|nr:MAG: hypothetical protein [Bacteriophage sp.]